MSSMVYMRVYEACNAESTNALNVESDVISGGLIIGLLLETILILWIEYDEATNAE